MLAMDASFILEYMRWESSLDYVSLVFGYGNSNSTSFDIQYFDIQYDIMKLENQIPLFVPIKIF